MFFKRLLGRMDAEDALLRLDSLTKEENLMTAARTLEIVDRVDRNVVALAETTQEFRDNVERVETTTRVVDRNIQQTYAGV
jgi:hypothetical protein